MKTIFRVLIILTVAALIGGLIYVGVNASNSPTTGFPKFEEDGERPQFVEGSEFHPEGDHDEREEREGVGFPGGVIKALVLMTLAGGIYSGIVWAGKKAKRTAAT